MKCVFSKFTVKLQYVRPCLFIVLDENPAKKQKKNRCRKQLHFVLLLETNIRFRLTERACALEVLSGFSFVALTPRLSA